MIYEVYILYYEETEDILILNPLSVYCRSLYLNLNQNITMYYKHISSILIIQNLPNFMPPILLFSKKVLLSINTPWVLLINLVIYFQPIHVLNSIFFMATYLDLFSGEQDEFFLGRQSTVGWWSSEYNESRERGQTRGQVIVIQDLK